MQLRAVVLFINVLYFIENYFTSVSALAFRPNKPRQAVPRLRSQPRQLWSRPLLSCKCTKKEEKARKKQHGVIVVLTSVYAGLSF